MEIAIWIVSGLVALAMFVAGVLKLVTPREKYVGMQPWVLVPRDRCSPPIIRAPLFPTLPCPYGAR